MSETPSTPASTWPGLTDPDHSAWYLGHFRELAAREEDVQGESRLVDVLAPRRARLLDAGCGPGRHAGHLARLGHDVVGVDIDEALLVGARTDHPGPRFHQADLATLDLPALGEEEPFDGALIAGNVLDFVTEPDRPTVVARLAAHLCEGGFLVIGCRTSRGVTPQTLDAWLPAAGLRLEHRFATWDLVPWHEGADFCVSVLRKDRPGRAEG